MELASSPAIPSALRAATPQLNEKPRLGFESWNPAPNPGIEPCKSTTALGMRGSLRLEGVRQSEHDGSYDITNPQSFNRYAYVLNNPLSFTDLLGLDCNDNNSTDAGTDSNGDTIWSGGCNCDQNPLMCYGGGSGGNGLCMWFGYCPGSQNNTGGGSAPPKPAPNNGCAAAPGLGIHGGAVVLSGEATVGLSKLGATAQGSAGFGFFGGQPGGFLSYVATAVAGGSSVGAPTQQGEVNGGQNPIIVGAYAGVGGGAMVTNATSVQQLSGTFQQYTLSLPALSLNFSYGGGIWSAGFSLGPPPITGRLFAAHTSTTTNTVVKGPC